MSGALLLQVKLRTTLCGLAVFDVESEQLLDWYPSGHITECVSVRWL
eukprot:SAG31_NODE_40096_length_283_cov_0.842391_2_plen_46_part_01